ncbi:unnamed protein product [Leptidea sinapis]|uniref:Uncharacterized protein n=1 Tax=Leptidea sinapis TaxID=189913 RepID=A0A5E4QHI7_9NEOP|nr:unnamed protein product [Leptidea sinapis]
MLLHNSVHTKVAALDWILHLYNKVPDVPADGRGVQPGDGRAVGRHRRGGAGSHRRVGRDLLVSRGRRRGRRDRPRPR